MVTIAMKSAIVSEVQKITDQFVLKAFFEARKNSYDE